MFFRNKKRNPLTQPAAYLKINLEQEKEALEEEINQFLLSTDVHRNSNQALGDFKRGGFIFSGQAYPHGQSTSDIRASIIDFLSATNQAEMNQFLLNFLCNYGGHEGVTSLLYLHIVKKIGLDYALNRPCASLSVYLAEPQDSPECIRYIGLEFYMNIRAFSAPTNNFALQSSTQKFTLLDDQQANLLVNSGLEWIHDKHTHQQILSLIQQASDHIHLGDFIESMNEHFKLYLSKKQSRVTQYEPFAITGVVLDCFIEQGQIKIKLNDYYLKMREFSSIKNLMTQTSQQVSSTSPLIHPPAFNPDPFIEPKLILQKEINALCEQECILTNEALNDFRGQSTFFYGLSFDPEMTNEQTREHIKNFLPLINNQTTENKLLTFICDCGGLNGIGYLLRKLMSEHFFSSLLFTPESMSFGVFIPHPEKTQTAVRYLNFSYVSCVFDNKSKHFIYLHAGSNKINLARSTNQYKNYLEEWSKETETQHYLCQLALSAPYCRRPSLLAETVYEHFCLYIRNQQLRCIEFQPIASGMLAIDLYLEDQQLKAKIVEDPYLLNQLPSPDEIELLRTQAQQDEAKEKEASSFYPISSSPIQPTNQLRLGFKHFFHRIFDKKMLSSSQPQQGNDNFDDESIRIFKK